MGRALAAIALLVGVLAAGAIAFLNGGAPQPIYVTPNRTVALPLGQALALAFASGAALIAVIALGTAIGRASRRWQRRRRAAREQAAVTRERVHAERLLVDGDADAARSRLADAVGAHAGDEHLLDLLAGAAEQSGDLPAAIAAVEDARTRRPESPLLTRRLCALYAAAGRWDDALALQVTLARAVRSPARAAEDTAWTCGLRYEAAMAEADARRAFRRLMGLAREHPGFVAAWVSAGDRLRDHGKPKRARRIWERGARVRPAAVLLERIAALDAAASHPEYTTKTLDRLRRHHPTDVGLAAAIVRHHLDTDALDRAAAALTTMPADATADPVLEALRGELARRRGDADAAATHLAHAAAEYLDPHEMRCRACGQAAPAWQSRCARCGRWDTLEPPAAPILAPTSVDLMPFPSRSTAENHCVTDGPG